MGEKEGIRFGNKDFGRTPIERLIIILEKNGLLRQVVNLLVLVILVGINSQIHNETTKGIQFLLIIFLILVSGNESTTNFFGAATLAIFIIIHLSMFGFNANALMLTFTIYLMFKSKLTKNFLGPISIYLLIDIFFVHYNINLTGFFNFFSEYIFSINTVIILSILPLTYLFLIAERKFIEKWSNNFFSKYLLFIIIAAIFGLTFLTGTILSDSSLTYFSYFLLMFYFIGAFSHKNDIITSVYLLLPLGLIILIAYILKQSLNL